MTPDIMTAEELGDYLQLSRSSVYKLVQHREIPYTKLGASLRFPKAIIDKWLRERTVYPHQSLLEEFELLYERFHLKKFLKAKGIQYQELEDQELVEQLRRAIEELRQVEQGGQEG